MTLRFKMTFKRGPFVVAQFDGVKTNHGTDITVDDMRQVIVVEQFLEKLLGLRVHIETLYEEDRTAAESGERV